MYVGGLGLGEGEYLGNDKKFSTTAPAGGYAHYANGVLTLNNYEYTGNGDEYVSLYDVTFNYTSSLYWIKRLIPLKSPLTW